MWPSLRPSQRASLLAAIPSQSASAVQSSGWVDASLFEWLVATINVGTISASGTVNAKLQQATSSGGAGAKDVANSAITALTQAGSNSNEEAWIEVKADQLDGEHGFRYVQLSITPAVAAAVIGGELYGFDPKIAQPGGEAFATTVAQIVSLPSI